MTYINRNMNVFVRTLISSLLSILMLAVWGQEPFKRPVIYPNEKNNDSILAEKYWEMGYFYSEDAFDSALYFFNKSMAIVKKRSDRYARFLFVEGLNEAARIYSIQGNLVKALLYFQQANTVLERLHEAFPENSHYLVTQAGIQLNMGVLSTMQQNYSQALTYFIQSETKWISLQDTFNIAVADQSIGETYMKLNENKKALLYEFKALKVFSQLGNVTGAKRKVATCYLNIGKTYETMGALKKAEKFLVKAINIEKPIHWLEGLVAAQNALSNLYYKKGEYQKSLSIAQKNLPLAKKIDFKLELKNTYELLSKNFASIDDFKKAYHYHILFKAMNDSIFNKESSDKLLELQTKFETQQKENEILVLKSKEERNRLERKMSIIGGGLLVVILFLILGFVLNKRRHERQLFENELEKKRLKAEELNNEIVFKTKQLTTHALNMMQKNNMLNDLQRSLDTIANEAKPEVKNNLSYLNRVIGANLKSEKDWEMFRIYFEQIDRGFYDRLTNRFPKLNVNDLRHCALMKLNMNLKETAAVLNLSPNTIKSARNRIKKKLNLGADQDLYEFVRSV